MFTPRTIPLSWGEQPWNWSDTCDSKYQCTWWAFYRALSVSFSAPCWYDGSGDTGYGAYTNAKDWLKNYRTPWEVKGIDYEPVAGDIAVFDGQYGHVQFLETNNMFSEYASGNPDSFKNGTFVKKSNLLGFLHYPDTVVSPVDRDVNVNQIQTTDTALRIRTKPSLDGDVVGFVQLGYYNVLDTKKADGYVWYKLAKDRWCANVSTIYLPSDETDIIKEIEEYFNTMKQKVNELSNENKKMADDMRKIEEISRRWL